MNRTESSKEGRAGGGGAGVQAGSRRFGSARGCVMDSDGQWWGNAILEKRSVAQWCAARLGRVQGGLLGSHWKACSGQ